VRRWWRLPIGTPCSPPASPRSPSSPARVRANGHRIVVKGDAGEAPLRLPLRGREPQGVLSVDAPGGIDAETRIALETFAGELGLALESPAWPRSSRAATPTPGTAA
jgi:hypothetical protein